MRFNKYSYTGTVLELPSQLSLREGVDGAWRAGPSSHWKSITRMHNVQNLFETPYGCYGVVGA